MAGVEIGQTLSRLGSQVTIVESAQQPLSGFDYEITSHLLRKLEGEGIRLYTEAVVQKVEKNSVYFRVRGDEVRVQNELLLIAAGREPNVAELHLENANVSYGRSGIKVKKSMETTNPRIYAAGDVADQTIKLETVAAREGYIAAENIYERANMEMDLLSVPRVIYTDPQVASVGLLESDCKGCRSSTVPISAISRARISRREDGIIKMVIDERERIVGIHIVSHNASEIIAEGALALRLGLKLDDIINTVHAFPTMSEALKIAAQSFRRDVTAMSCCVE